DAPPSAVRGAALRKIRGRPILHLDRVLGPEVRRLPHGRAAAVRRGLSRRARGEPEVSHGTKDLMRAEQVKIPEGHFLRRVPLIGIGVGVVAAILAYATAGSPRAFAFSWLLALVFFLSLALGALFFVLIHYATQAGWGIVVRRLGENVMATIPLFALLFLPIA